ncbi:MAG: hypothetical protein HFI75_08790 [Lachnospiraceae bacterium]|nr:hypothetical protein [Lachnospiraceae bacterium]
MNYANHPNYNQMGNCRNCQNRPYPMNDPYTMNQEGWHGTWQNRPQPMPYYMAYPYPMFMQGEDDDERDLEKLQSMFPKAAQMIQPVVEEECDRMEYDGSLMFDEYPDKLMMERLIENIYQRVQSSGTEENYDEAEEDSVFATQCRNCNGNRFGDGLQDLISVMLFEEMHRRRCRRRRCKRWW